MNQVVSFPEHNIDPRDKGEKWCLQAAKAITSNWGNGMQIGSIFYAKRVEYDKIDSYYMAMQSVMQYIEWQTGEKNPSSSWINTDQSIDALVKTHVQKILGRLKKIRYNITATPLDPTAKSKLDEWFDAMRIKIIAREEAAKMNPAMAQAAPLMSTDGEPEDLEELQLATQFSPKFIRAKDVEQAISMLFYENEFDKLLDLIDEDIVKYGVCVLREGIDENNKIFIERFAPADFVCSYSETGNFDKLSSAGVYKRVTLSSLAHWFDEATLERIAKSVVGKYGNPNYYSTSISKGWDPFKVEIFDFEHKSYDSVAYEEKINRFGNKRFGKTSYSDLKKNDKTYTGQGAKPRYSESTTEEIYKGKWVVGTDYIYDFGKATNTKRSMDIKKAGETSLSFLSIASMFNKMRAKGILEDLIPIANEIQMVVQKMRTLRNTMITNGIAIDFSALEGVALGENGADLSPKEVLDMFLQTGVLAFRSENIIEDGKNQRKAVEPVVMQGAQELANMWVDYQNLMNKLYETSGLNQATDAATVNPKMLVGVQQNINAGTNNALYFLENARRKIVEKLARNLIPRFQTALLMGDYEGYANVLGDNTIEYFKFAAKQFPCDYSIIVEDRPTDEQKQIVFEMMREEIKEGNLTSADVFNVINAYNLKDAQIILEARARKNKQKAQEFAMQQQQMNDQLNQNTKLIGEKAAQETLKVEYALKMQLEDKKGEWQYKIEQLRLQGSAATTVHNNATKLAAAAMGKDNGGGMVPYNSAEPETPEETMQEQGVEEPAMA